MERQQKRDRETFERGLADSNKKRRTSGHDTNHDRRKPVATHSRDHVRGQSKGSHEVSAAPPRPRQSPTNQPAPSAHLSKPPSIHASKSLPVPLPPLPPISPSLADQVFTHQSAARGANITKVNQSYDRLEFLGDAYIEHIASTLIYNRYPSFPAGRLSQQRELLVKNETLAQFAVAYGFDKQLKAMNEVVERERNQAKVWEKVMGDVLEAYVAAIVLSDKKNGFSKAKEWLEGLWEGKLAGLEGKETSVVTDPMAKSALSRKVVSKGSRLEYVDEAREEKVGKTWFSIGVFFTGWGFEKERLGGGIGLSKQEAGQRAAAEALGSTVTAQIARIKAAHDQKAREEREAREAREKEASEEAGLGDDKEKMGKSDERQ